MGYDASVQYPDGHAMRVRVANEADMARFKWSLEQVGNEQFPVLRAALPQTSGTWTQQASAARVMDELIALIKQPNLGIGAFIVETDTGQEIQRYIPSRQGVFRHHPRADVDLGVDPAGFFIARRHIHNDPVFDLMQTDYRLQDPRQDVFRAMRFEGHRRRIEHDVDGMEFIDLDSGARYLCWPGAGGGTHLYHGHPRSSLELPDGIEAARWHVAVRYLTHEDYRDIIQALIYLCRAAMETGNPIVWGA